MSTLKDIQKKIKKNKDKSSTLGSVLGSSAKSFTGTLGTIFGGPSKGKGKSRKRGGSTFQITKSLEKFENKRMKRRLD